MYGISVDHKVMAAKHMYRCAGVQTGNSLFYALSPDIINIILAYGRDLHWFGKSKIPNGFSLLAKLFFNHWQYP